MLLKDKVSIITGSAQGIGLGIAKLFAQEGSKVVITDRNSDICLKSCEELKSQGFNAVSIPCDVTNIKDVENLFVKTAENFGKVDILVNNAGIFPFVKFEDMTENDWDKVMSVNLKGMFFCSQFASKVMTSGSKIVNISSIASVVGFEGLVHYCTTKGGVNSFTRTLALEIASKKINVNAVAPGAIETPGAAMTEETKNNTLKLIPLSRIGMPEDIAKASLFFASNLSDYITGQTLIVDGGWTLR